MGYVVVLSLPLILLVLVIALACYLVGRARGREETITAFPVVYPAPPPPIQQAEDQDPSVKPPV
ncbi:hypothetical protein MKX01_003534 [Papaver californicum]|nr:hypothetical protein MKX01_003534 [Papaver californicum]